MSLLTIKQQSLFKRDVSSLLDETSWKGYDSQAGN